MSEPQDLLTLVSQALEQRTPMNQMQCRGTVRLALRKSGLDPKAVSVTEMLVVLRQVLPREIDVRGIEEGARICKVIAAELAGVEIEAPNRAAAEHTDSVLRRIFS